MALKNNPVLVDAVAVFVELPIHEQREILFRFQNIHEEALKKRRQELLSELHALGSPSEKGANGGTGTTQVARYRSKKNPLLVWSGRGRMARWLVDEMRASGLTKDAFRVI